MKYHTIPTILKGILILGEPTSFLKRLSIASFLKKIYNVGK